MEDGGSNQDLLGFQYGFTSKDIIVLKARYWFAVQILFLNCCHLEGYNIKSTTQEEVLKIDLYTT